MPTINIENDNAKTMTEFTRVYKLASNGSIKTGPVSVALEDIASVVPSNRLGKKNHRSTITLSNGATFELSDLYSAVSAELASIAA